MQEAIICQGRDFYGMPFDLSLASACGPAIEDARGIKAI